MKKKYFVVGAVVVVLALIYVKFGQDVYQDYVIKRNFNLAIELVYNSDGVDASLVRMLKQEGLTNVEISDIMVKFLQSCKDDIDIPQPQSVSDEELKLLEPIAKDFRILLLFEKAIKENQALLLDEAFQRELRSEIRRISRVSFYQHRETMENLKSKRKMEKSVTIKTGVVSM